MQRGREPAERTEPTHDTTGRQAKFLTFSPDEFWSEVVLFD